MSTKVPAGRRTVSPGAARRMAAAIEGERPIDLDRGRLGRGDADHHRGEGQPGNGGQEFQVWLGSGPWVNLTLPDCHRPRGKVPARQEHLPFGHDLVSTLATSRIIARRAGKERPLLAMAMPFSTIAPRFLDRHHDPWPGKIEKKKVPARKAEKGVPNPSSPAN